MSNRNRELGSYREDSFVRCGRCGFICNKDRDAKANNGSRAGEGISYRQVYRETTIVDGVVTGTENTT